VNKVAVKEFERELCKKSKTVAKTPKYTPPNSEHQLNSENKHKVTKNGRDQSVTLLGLCRFELSTELKVTSELPRHKWRELPESSLHLASPPTLRREEGGAKQATAGGTHPARFKRTREALKSRSKVKLQKGQ
jgi:hypothetical protein